MPSPTSDSETHPTPEVPTIPPARLALAGAVLFALGILCSIFAARGKPFAWDQPVALWVQAHLTAIPLAEAFDLLGNYAVTGAAAVLVGIALIFRREWASVLTLAALILIRPINLAHKDLVARSRPDSSLVAVFEQENGYGYPSGHTFGSMLIAVTLAGVMPRLIPHRTACRIVQAVLILFALAVGWSRVDLGAHWPSDVLGAWLWGAGLGMLLVAAGRALDARWHPNSNKEGGASAPPSDTHAIQ